MATTKRIGRTKKGRANGHGTLEKTPGGIYIARWTANGKRFSKSTGVRDEREAARLLEEYTAPYRLETEKRTLETIATRIEGKSAEIRQWHDQQPALAVADGFESYCACGLAPDSGERTLSGYESHYKRLTRWIKDNRPDMTELRQFSQADAAAFAATLRDEAAAGTYNKHIVFFRCLWRTLANADEGKPDTPPKAGEYPKAKLACNPWEKIQKREVIEHVRRELTLEELAKVCKAVTGEMRLLFALGIYTGLRLGDCALLDWGSIDLARRLISVIPRKTARHAHGKPTIIPLHATLAAMLAETDTDARTGYVLPDTAELYQRNDSLLARHIHRVFVGCGIKTQSGKEGERAKVDVGFHSLRHTFVSLSANAGAPLAIVQAIVGHSNPAMTRHYFHESENALTNAVAALPDVTQENTKATARDAAQAALAAFRAAVDALPPDALAKASAYLAKRTRKQ